MEADRLHSHSKVLLQGRYGGPDGSGTVSGERLVSDPTPPELNRIALLRVGLRPPRSPWHLRKPISRKGTGAAHRGPLVCHGTQNSQASSIHQSLMPRIIFTSRNKTLVNGKGPGS